jgi:TonB-dependent receptor
MRRGSLTVFGFMAGVLAGAAAAQEAGNESAVEEVVVTGYRASLESSAEAKRQSTNFTDSIFAEDIGKFPDLNIAESLNRIPGIQLTREINGEGLNIAIRGLGSNFTKTMLNGAQIAVASSGRTDSTNQNRELDLDLFPTELFTRLDVSKSPRASMIEGGVSGVVNMRSARPFDSPGRKFSYQLQGNYGEESEEFSPRAAATYNWTNDTFGVLVGAAVVRNKAKTLGYETIGWTNPTVTHGQCGTTPTGTQNLASASGACNTTGGNGWGFPNVNSNAMNGPITGIGVTPAGAGAGIPAGVPIDRGFLEGLNPGYSLEQIGNALIPRLSRPSYSAGDRDRTSGLISFEFRPTDSLHFYLDTFYAEADRAFDRLDMNLVGRNGGIIPVGLTLDDNNVVTAGTFANAQFFLEARPYDEDVNFYNINPGLHFEPSEMIAVDFQMNKTKSNFFREAPTILVNTPLGQGITVDYSNQGGNFPSVVASADLNDPGIGWTWAGGRVNIQNERRDTETQGAHLDVRLGTPERNVTIGAAFDDVSRVIKAFDASREWQQVVCGGGGAFVPAPNPQPACNGGGASAISSANLASYLVPGPAGFITVDFDRFFNDTNYHALSDSAPLASGSATSARTGGVQEKTTGGYVEGNYQMDLAGRSLRANAGIRFINTSQTISGPRNVGGITDPGPFLADETTYTKSLPSANIAYNITESIIARLSGSRTLTRPDPSAMIPAVQFGDVGATNANVGNTELVPFISDNIDVGAEWYTGDEGFIGVTYFRKKIEGFTVNQTTTIPFLDLGIPFVNLTPDQQNAINGRGGPNAATVNLQQQVNADGELTLKGYEVTWVQPLGRLFEPLTGFGFNLNYTNVKQTGEGAAPAVAIGISPDSYNATAYYEKGPASVRLSYVWSDDQIQSQFNEQGIALARRFGDAYKQLDLSASYEFASLPTSPMVTLNVINITSESQRSTFQFPNAAFTYYEPGYQVLLGVRGRF